jgi:hypothetical protein
MNDKRYWFPVRPTRHGWGWALPQVWQGWAVLLIFLVLIVGGSVMLAPYGQFAYVSYSVCAGALLLGVGFWKGEPQSMRDDSPYDD